MSDPQSLNPYDNHRRPPATDAAICAWNGDFYAFSKILKRCDDHELRSVLSELWFQWDIAVRSIAEEGVTEANLEVAGAGIELTEELQQAAHERSRVVIDGIAEAQNTVLAAAGELPRSVQRMMDLRMGIMRSAASDDQDRYSTTERNTRALEAIDGYAAEELIDMATMTYDSIVRVANMIRTISAMRQTSAISRHREEMLSFVQLFHGRIKDGTAALKGFWTGADPFKLERYNDLSTQTDQAATQIAMAGLDSALASNSGVCECGQDHSQAPAGPLGPNGIDSDLDEAFQSLVADFHVEFPIEFPND